MASTLTLVGFAIVGAGIFTWGYVAGSRNAAEDHRIASLEMMHSSSRRHRYMLELAQRVADTLKQSIEFVPDNSFIKAKAEDVISEWDEHYL